MVHTLGLETNKSQGVFYYLLGRHPGILYKQYFHSQISCNSFDGDRQSYAFGRVRDQEIAVITIRTITELIKAARLILPIRAASSPSKK